MLHRRDFMRLAASAATLPALSGTTGAQGYPARAITLVVPYAAGGSADTLPRVIAERMRASLGKPIIVENVTGAAGSIGAGRIARAAPDGYTFGLGTWSTHVANAAIYPLQYDVKTGFRADCSDRVQSAADRDRQEPVAEQFGGIDCLAQSQSGQDIAGNQWSR